jgi:hypothetical protein
MSEKLHIFVRQPDGTEADITEGVQALYDLVIGSMDWGSGFWSAEDAAPVARLARLCGFEQAEEAERYLREQQHSEEQRQFFLEHREAVEKHKAMSGYGHEVPHDHVFSSAGRCMWPYCGAREESVPSAP